MADFLAPVARPVLQPVAASLDRRPIGLSVGLKALFLKGETGFWYDAGIARLFQDDAGTTPVTVDGNPVGYIADRSGNGKNATQATPGNKPSYDIDLGKSSLIFDGVNDVLNTGVLPAAMRTIAVAARIGAINQMAMGVGNNGSGTRLFLGSHPTTGVAAAGWGNQTSSTIFGGSDIRGQDRVLILVGDASTVALYVDGAQVYSGASSGMPGGTDAMRLGAIISGTVVSNWMSGMVHGGLARSVRSTADEIQMINSQLRSLIP